MRVSLIVATDRNEAIGRHNRLPWHLPADLQRFRALTTGHVVVVGALTQQSIVGRLGKALPDRVSVVVSRRMPESVISGVIPAISIDHATEIAQTISRFKGIDEWFVIGGHQIYEQCLPQVSRVYRTLVDTVVAGADTFMPPNWLADFALIETSSGQDGDLPITFETYDRS
nr:Dihydrofolate reductase [uncultured bacterium]